MIGFAAITGFIGRLPRPFWYIGAAGGALLLLWFWHDGKVDSAFEAGAAKQAAADRGRVEQAAVAAEKAQQKLVRSLATKQVEVTKGTENALVAKNADLARRYDDLRLRWAAYRADQGGAGDGGATALPSTAGGIDATACAAAGWVSFDTAATAAEAADGAIARDDAWRAWVTAQAAAWPGQEAP